MACPFSAFMPRPGVQEGRSREGTAGMSGVAGAQGMTGADKSVIVADLLAQIGHQFGFRLIVEEGLSHGVLTETQGCEPILINPNGNLCVSESLLSPPSGFFVPLYG